MTSQNHLVKSILESSVTSIKNGNKHPKIWTFISPIVFLNFYDAKFKLKSNFTNNYQTKFLVFQSY